MRKTVDLAEPRAGAQSRTMRGPTAKGRLMPDDHLTIAAGSSASCAGLTALLGESVAPISIKGDAAQAVAGGAQAAAIASRTVQTVSLSDGTRIVFAAVTVPQDLEST